MSGTASNFVGSVPKFYDSGLVPVIFTDYAQDITRRVVKKKPRLVLELAAGTGVVTRMLRDGLSKKCEIIASDLNEPMLEVASQKFKDSERVSFQPVDAMDIPLADGSIDVVVCQFGVMFFPDKVRSYREALRVLKPGGHYIFSAWDSHAANPFAAIGQGVVEKAFPDDPPGFYRVPFHYHDPKEMKQDMKMAGFASVKVKRLQIKKTIPSLESFAQGFVFGNPICEEVKARGGDPEVLEQEVLAAYKGAFGESSPAMPLSAFVVTGKK